MFPKDRDRIFRGLNEIGPSIANFYADGVSLLDTSCTLVSKANLIAHLAREIDSGLRSVFAPEKIKQEKLLILGEERGHFASILAAVGKDDPEDLLAKEWFTVAKRFHKVAHREEAHKPSKNPKEAFELWGRYEKILGTFVGSFYAMLSRLDSFINLDEAPTQSLHALKNVLSNTKHASYFFGKLNKPNWIVPLIEEGFFDLDAAPKKDDKNAHPEEWIVMRFLANIARVANNGVDTKIKTIVDTVIEAYLDKHTKLHPFTIANIAQVIVSSDSFAFTETEEKFFQQATLDSEGSFLFFDTYLFEHLPQKLLRKTDKRGLIQFVSYVFGFTLHEQAGFDFADFKIGPSKKIKPNVDEHFIGEFVSEYGEKLIKLLGIEPLRIVIQKLGEIDKAESFEISTTSIPSIEPSNQSHFHHQWITKLIEFIRDYAEGLNEKNLNAITEELLYSKVNILQRLGFHLMRVTFPKMKSKWWEFICSQDEDVYIHEPYLLIKETSNSYTLNEFKDVIKWIEKINRVKEDETAEGAQEENTNFRNYKIRRWLTALNPGSEETAQLFEEVNKHYDTLNDWNLEHPEFDSYSTSFSGPDIPVKLEDFDQLSIEQQLAFVQSFVPKHLHDTSEEGLSLILKLSVAKDPDKYLFELNSFLDIKNVFLEGLIEGFTIGIRENKIVEYSPILRFIEKKVYSDDFINTTSRTKDDKRGFIYRLVDFYKVLATKENDYEFTEEAVIQIIAVIIDLIEREEFMDASEEIFNGYINHTLNSLQGRLHETLLELTLLFAKLFHNDNDEVKWPTLVKEYFTSRLKNFSYKDKDYSIILGSRLPILMYLDPHWVKENIDLIFNENNEIHFEYRLAGSLSRIYRPNKNFYNLFKINGLFIKALNKYHGECQALDTVILYAMLELQFWGLSMNDSESIFYELLERKNPEHFKRIVDVSWKNKLLSIENVKLLWKRILDTVDDRKEFESLAIMLLWFAEMSVLLDDEVVELIESTISKITTKGGNLYSFVRHIYKIADSNLEAAAGIIASIFEKNIISPYPERDLTLFVEKLYQKNLKEKANDICIAVSETGSLVLKELFNKYN